MLVCICISGWLCQCMFVVVCICQCFCICVISLCLSQSMSFFVLLCLCQCVCVYVSVSVCLYQCVFYEYLSNPGHWWCTSRSAPVNTEGRGHYRLSSNPLLFSRRLSSSLVLSYKLMVFQGTDFRRNSESQYRSIGVLKSSDLCIVRLGQVKLGYIGWLCYIREQSMWSSKHSVQLLLQ